MPGCDRPAGAAAPDVRGSTGKASPEGCDTTDAGIVRVCNQGWCNRENRRRHHIRGSADMAGTSSPHPAVGRQGRQQLPLAKEHLHACSFGVLLLPQRPS